MTYPKPGTRVHVEFDAVARESSYGITTVEGPDGRKHYLGDGVKLTVIKLTDWVKYGGAQVGDIWEAAGKEFWVRPNMSKTLEVVLISWEASGSESYYENDQADFADLNPRLVRRRGYLTGPDGKLYNPDEEPPF